MLGIRWVCGLAAFTLRCMAWNCSRLGLVLWLALLAGFAGHAQAGSRVLSLPGDRVVSAIVLAPDAAMPGEVPETEMRRRLAGVMAEVTARDVARLAKLGRRASAEPPAEPTAVADVVLIGRKSSGLVAVSVDGDGTLWMTRGDGDSATVATLRAEAMGVLGAWLRFAGPFEALEGDGPVRDEVKGIAVPHEIRLDDKGVVSRFVRGNRRTKGARYELRDETLFVRVPTGYDPRVAAGLVVWVDPTDRGEIPRVFDAGLDAMGFVAIGAAGAGNGRHWPDRLQLALDGVATASAHYNIDPDRVYVAGLSGGGRIASMMVLGCPDVFAGGMAIAGLNSYQRARTPDGKTWPASMTKPGRDLWALARYRRIAAVTGPGDFNRDQMRAYADGLEADGLVIGWFEYADMGHTLPTPERFTDVLAWLDEPLREARSRELAWVRSAMDGVDAGDGIDDGEAATLRGIIDRVAWSDEAYRAIGMLEQAGR